MKKNLARVYVHLTIAALMVFSFSACHKSPTEPTTCNDPNAINNGQFGDCRFPNSLAGTTVQMFPLPGTDKPLLAWITAVHPDKNVQLAPGQSASVQWTCAIPGGYSAWISTHYIIAGQTSDPNSTGGGLSINSSGDCGLIADQLLASNITGDVIAFRFSVWTAQGSIRFSDIQGKPADFVREEPLGWKMPK